MHICNPAEKTDSSIKKSSIFKKRNKINVPIRTKINTYRQIINDARSDFESFISEKCSCQQNTIFL